MRLHRKLIFIADLSKAQNTLLDTALKESFNGVVPVRKPTNNLTRSAAKGIFYTNLGLHISRLRPAGWFLTDFDEKRMIKRGEKR